MDNKIINNETELIEKGNNPVKKMELENDINKANDINTTKEEDSIYIADEIISYCSSPTSGIVSIKKTKRNNNAIISLGSEISNITNTITLNIAMIKKEINNTELNHIERSNTDKKKINANREQKDGENNNIYFINSKTCSNKDYSQNERDKRDKIKSYFKKKTKRLKENKVNTKTSIEDINMKKKASKGKRKKTKKSQEKFDNFKICEHSKSSTNIEKDKNIKKNRKKTQKPKEHDMQKILSKKNEPEPEKEKDQTDLDEGKSPKIIILDFSASGNNEENEYDTEKDLIFNKSREEEKNENYNTKHSVNLSSNNSFAKIPENEFFLTKNKTKNENNENNENSKDLKKEFEEKKFIIPKSKNSCLIESKTYKINNHTKFDNSLNNRKLSANCGSNVNGNSIAERKSIPKNEENQKGNRKDKKRKKSEEFFLICASKNFNHNDDSCQNKILNTSTIKENMRNSTKIRIKSKINEEKKCVPPKKKDSNKSCHNTPNKKFRHIISHNYDQKINQNIEKKLNINMSINSKALESTKLNFTPKNIRPKKNIYQSNRNLTNIKISSQAVENKDIHLEMNGKQETIINYTNQEMVDDENEYMIECFKVLLKLDLSKQPRCKTKVNFNFENSPTEKNKKKIALFDLDETLVHCTKDKAGLNGDSVKIKLPTNKVVNVGLNIRPHWKEALDLIKNHYHIVVYTASHQSYADAVLDYLDKENKYFQYRLYRNHCVQCDVNGIKFYVKDLDTLNEKYNLKDVVLIDNSVLSFAYHLNNGIPIVPYIEQKEDSQLLMLAYYLVSIANFDDLTEENKKHINIEHFIQQVKILENEEDEEEDEEEEGEENNNKITEEENKEKNQENNDNKTNENKNVDSNSNNNKDKLDDSSMDDSNTKELRKQSSFGSKKNGKKLSCRRSEKALKIANDMKKNMNDVYKKNYN